MSRLKSFNQFGEPEDISRAADYALITILVTLAVMLALSNFVVL